MKTPSVTVEDELYLQFLDKIEVDDITITQFINNAITNYLKEPPKVTKVIQTVHPADSIITELALRLVEKTLSSYQRVSPDQISSYNVVNEMCLELLPLIDTPQSKLLQQEFNQDDALMIISKRIYKFP